MRTVFARLPAGDLMILRIDERPVVSLSRGNLLVSAPVRHSPRIQPPCQIVVAIAEDGGREVAYGVVVDISRTGACVWTDMLLPRGAQMRLRMSLSYPPEVHALGGEVTWARPDPESPLKNAYCCGFRWLSVGYTLRRRLDQLASTGLHKYNDV
jgi:hypothetical protein